jgi:hypothetical protein
VGRKKEGGKECIDFLRLIAGDSRSLGIIFCCTKGQVTNPLLLPVIPVSTKRSKDHLLRTCFEYPSLRNSPLGSIPPLESY